MKIRMNVWFLVKRELRYKKLGFLTGVFSLLVATAGVVGFLTLLSGYDLATDQLLVEKERELRAEMVGLEDDYRRIMRAMGYNILILNREQSIPELRIQGHPNTYLDYQDVWKLAHGDLTTLNHLLPVLQEKILWEEQGMEIMLSGIRGQVPVFQKPEFLTDDDQYRSPITERVPEGKADIGYTVATSLNLRPGTTISIRGEEFQVNRIRARRGTTDDLTVWIPLDKAQAILGREGKINGILALECVCELDELGMISEEVTAILPHAQVFEFTSLIIARAEVRQRAEQVHRKVVASVMTHREDIRGEKERFAAIVIPLLAAGAAIWIFVLIFNNVRERRQEIGILRAVGFTRGRILKVFLAKSLFMGLAGGIAGCLLGIFIGIRWSGLGFSGAVILDLLTVPTLAAGLLLAPALSFTAGFIPSVLAANQDPADVLREE